MWRHSRDPLGARAVLHSEATHTVCSSIPSTVHWSVKQDVGVVSNRWISLSAEMSYVVAVTSMVSVDYVLDFVFSFSFIDRSTDGTAVSSCNWTTSFTQPMNFNYSSKLCRVTSAGLLASGFCLIVKLHEALKHIYIHTHVVLHTYTELTTFTVLLLGWYG